MPWADEAKAVEASIVQIARVMAAMVFFRFVGFKGEQSITF